LQWLWPGKAIRSPVWCAEQAEELKALGIVPVVGTLDDNALLTEQAGRLRLSNIYRTSPSMER
jgi:hypothetical protein